MSYGNGGFALKLLLGELFGSKWRLSELIYTLDVH